MRKFIKVLLIISAVLLTLWIILIDPVDYHLNEYESRVMSWFGPGMGPYSEEMLRRLAEQVASAKPSR